jgi:hypothetical protein
VKVEENKATLMAGFTFVREKPDVVIVQLATAARRRSGPVARACLSAGQVPRSADDQGRHRDLRERNVLGVRHAGKPPGVH